MLHACIANEELSQHLQLLSSSLAVRACSNVEHNYCLKDQLRIKTGAFYEGESAFQEKKANRQVYILRFFRQNSLLFFPFPFILA